jgi:hypothetical protein
VVCYWIIVQCSFEDDCRLPEEPAARHDVLMGESMLAPRVFNLEAKWK